LGIFCIIACVLLQSTTAFAADTTPSSPEAGKHFASVWRIKGEVAATSGTTGKERILREGDPVFVGERVRAASTAEAVLKTDDAGAVAIRPSAEFVAERFSAQGDSSDNLTVRLITGSLRVVTGWIASTNRSGHQIITPTASIGIRGTDHEPYVLARDLVGATTYRAGTYDKVNRGATTLDAAGKTLDIDAGKVGFARYSDVKARALLTLLLPVLLDKVPDFYVPGEFDAELDRYSQTADEVSLQQLEQRRKGAVAAPAAECVPSAIAKTWIDMLDGAIVRKDAPGVIALFAPEVAVRAIVIRKDGSTATIDLGRDEFAQSTIAAVKQLENYQHRRVSLEASRTDEEGGTACTRIGFMSVVVEQGLQAVKPFRFESQEEYLLELRAGKWLAIKAETTQR
jgi:hypothetical protein